MNNAQTISQAHEATQQSLWHFLAQLPQTQEAQLLYGLILAGAVGMVANYLVKWAKGEIEGNLWCYLVKDKLRATVLSFSSYVGVAVASIAAGIFVTDGGIFVGWSTVLWFGVTNGFAVDAIANKGRRPEWSEGERRERAKP